VASLGKEEAICRQKLLTQADFGQQIAEGITLVDLWAPWCGPCKIQLEIVEDLAVKIEGKAVLAKVNVDEEPDLASQYSIMSIPTLLLFKNGKLLDTMVGIQNKELLEHKLNHA
jgi:thioredoxin 1